MDHNRLFLAIELATEQRTRLTNAVQELSTILNKVKWVRPEAMHITVKFLGRVSNDRVEAIDQAVSKAVSTRVPFTFGCAGIGVFPSPRKASVIWAGITRGRGELTAMAQAVLEELEEEGFEPERRPFAPHVTLGRVRRGGRLPRAVVEQAIEKFAQTTFGTSDASHVTLFSSTLTQDGPSYTPLRQWALSAR